MTSTSGSASDLHGNSGASALISVDYASDLDVDRSLFRNFAIAESI